ncbi:hypothetical protein GALMADRAFT_115932 [Galerina marginata CBS 339.88]|uniref:Uncharacterized protein n=1 Tax=Galerina marginata (strain CBS 339.88) TaxID=685588 RepID=A0A067TPJ2_GALM3|nr:hypothetical protein GALMADRAFT_115932 [Galerina marginata CBS 339.88]
MSDAPRQIVVDDNDSSIFYSDTWFTTDSGSNGFDGRGNFGPTLKSTLHGTNSSGTLRFTFSGSQMSVFGTIDTKNSSDGTTDPSWECLIDGVQIPIDPFQFFENNWVLCNADNLSNSSHVLTVNASAHKRTFWLDYLKYTPSDSDDFNDALVFVPHTDAEISYDHHWEPLGAMATVTNLKDSTATFSFIGVSATWYGIVPSERPSPSSFGTYSIDSGPHNAFVLQGLNPGEVTQYNQKFFETPILPSGPHSITVTYGGNPNSTPLTLLYLLIQNGISPLNTNSTPSSSIPLSLPSSTSPLSTLSGDVKKINTAGIVGGVLGLVLLLFLLAFLLFRYRKQRKQRNPTSKTPRKLAVLNPFRVSFRSSIPRPIETNSLSTLNLFGPPSTPPATRIMPSHRRRRSSYDRFDLESNQPSGSQSYSRVAQPSGYSDNDTSSYDNQPSGSRSKKQLPRPSKNLDDLDENASYYGGYQTWGQAKALEAVAGSKPRDSYI